MTLSAASIYQDLVPSSTFQILFVISIKSLYISPPEDDNRFIIEGSSFPSENTLLLDI